MSDTQHPYDFIIHRLEERLARAEVRLAKLEVKAGHETIVPDAPVVVAKPAKAGK